jgi:prepilin-type N-terminal cleavage/methylation domain-containing protein
MVPPIDHMPHRSRRRNGFTLIEMTVVIVLIGILALHLQPPLLHAMQARTQVTEDMDAIRKLRHGVDRIVRELRQVEFDDDWGFLIEPMNISGNASGGICFSRLGPQDPSGGPVGTVVGFAHAAGTPGTVTYGSGGLGAGGSPSCNAWAIDIVDEVRSRAFTYWAFDATGALVQLAPGADDLQSRLRMVEVTLSVDAGALGGATQATRVWLRNSRS